MKQRTVVQAVIVSDNNILLVRRSQGSPDTVGKYELVGGSIDDNEQPDDALRRHLKNSLGLNIDAGIFIEDVLMLHSREKIEVQQILTWALVEYRDHA